MNSQAPRPTLSSSRSRTTSSRTSAQMRRLSLMPEVQVPRDGNFRTHKWILIWLVVWNIWFICPHIGNVIIPTDELIFFRGAGSTTNQFCMLSTCNFRYLKWLLTDFFFAGPWGCKLYMGLMVAHGVRQPEEKTKNRWICKMRVTFFPQNIGIRHVLLDCASSGQPGHCRWLPKSSWRAWFLALSRASSFSKTTSKINIENPHVWSPTPNKDIRKHPKTINTSWHTCFVFYRSSKFQNSTFHFSSSISDLKRSISIDHHAHVLISMIQISSLIFSFSLSFL